MSFRDPDTNGAQSSDVPRSMVVGTRLTRSKNDRRCLVCFLRASQFPTSVALAVAFSCSTQFVMRLHPLSRIFSYYPSSQNCKIQTFHKKNLNSLYPMKIEVPLSLKIQLSNQIKSDHDFL